MDRRTLLCGLLALTAPAVTTACGPTAPTRRPGVGSGKPGDRIAALADVPVGGGALVDVSTDGQLLLLRPTDAGLRAFNPACPHAGATVNPPTAGTVACLAHGSTFDPATGEVLSGPVKQDLTEVPVRVMGQDVLLA